MRTGESGSEYLWRLRRLRKDQTASKPSTREAAIPNVEWSEHQAMDVWTVLAARFARAVDDGISDAQGRLSELSKGRKKRPIVSLDTCGRELHHQLLTDLRTSTDLSSAECYHEIQREAQPSAHAKRGRAERPPRNEFDEKRDAIIFTAIKAGLKGREYRKFLDDNHCDLCSDWSRNYGWPGSYAAATSNAKSGLAGSP